MDEDDFIQEGYFAMLKAKETYDPDNGSWAGWYLFALRNHIRSLFNPRNIMVSLDEPVTEEGDLRLVDTIASGEDLEQETVNRIWQEQASATVASALAKLDDTQREILQRVDMGEETKKDVAGDMGITPSRLQSIRFKAHYRLAHDPDILQLIDDQTDYYAHVREHGIEDIVIRRDDAERREIRRKVRDMTE